MKTNRSTWALPLLKKKLLSGGHVTQAEMLEATDGRGWRLSAAIFYLNHNLQWRIERYDDPHGFRHYHLEPEEIQRIRAEQALARSKSQTGGLADVLS